MLYQVCQFEITGGNVSINLNCDHVINVLYVVMSVQDVFPKVYCDTLRIELG